MRVVRIVSELDFGGVEKVLANSLPALQNQKGLELKIIVLGQGGKVADELAAKGIPIQILGFNPRIPNFKLLKKLQRILSILQPDVVHTQGGEANFHGIWAAKLASVPLIIGEEIGIPNHHTYWRYVFKWVYRKANKVIAISEAVKEAIVLIGEVEAGKVSVIYNPINSSGGQIGPLAVDSRQSTKRQQFVFVCTCRLVPIKNLDRLLDSFASLVKANPNRDILLKIVGEGPERENLEFRIQHLELGNNFELVGFQQDVWPYLLGANAFILPSLREGSSVSLAEAMTAGLPSIVTKVGGASEVLGDSQSGILIDPLNTQDIQSAMQELLEIPLEVRIAMGQRAIVEAKRFSTEHYIDSLMAIYNLS